MLIKPISLSDAKDKKEYGVKSLVNDILDIHECDEIEMLAVVYKKSDGTVGVGTTSGNNAEFIGLIELAKLQYMDEV